MRNSVRSVDNAIRLHLITDFLDSVVEVAAKDLNEIERRNEEGEFREFSDYEAVRDFPFSRVEIASKAVLYEVTALVEHGLCSAAHRPWLESDDKKGPKHLFELRAPFSESLSSLRMVTDLRFGDVVNLLESHYGISVRTLPGWEVLMKARYRVNSFKHSDGFEDFRKVPFAEVEIGRKHSVGPDEARAVIAAARSFMEALGNSAARSA
jgi:hypothetical protein